MDRRSTLRMVHAAGTELDRAMREIRIPGHPRPYFISYLLRDEESWRVQARFGSRIADTHERKRNAYVDVRVGSHRFDHVRDGGLMDNDKDSESYGYVELPYGRDLDALRHGLWRLTDARYREAAEELLQKRSHAITYRNPHRHLPAFERREKVEDVGWRSFPAVDRERWARRVERLSAMLREYPEITDSHLEFQADHACHSFLSSEGSRVVECRTVWSLDCYLWRMSEGGDGIPWTVRHAVRDPDELPDDRTFRRQIRAGIETLRRLAAAPTLRSYSGPALLDPVPAGLLVHEALGHRLEGCRMLASGEGQTFRDSVGERILPEFLSIHDDPRMESHEGRSLIGHYRYDDEGVEAEDARLVEDGRLVGFLTGRTGVVRPHRSNGHARNSYHQRPISRMGVTVVESHEGLEDAEMKRRLIEMVRRQNAPYGLRILDATSGETSTDAYDFQAFLGDVNLATRVYPDGREEWIRGVNFVGTPLNAIRSIVAAGKRREVDNAYCGAESGYVPVSTISPSLLVSEMELQGKPEAPYTPFTLPIPWERKKA